MELKLVYVGSDSWDRPCYATPDGEILVDTTPIASTPPELCTKSGIKYDKNGKAKGIEGEPDTPITDLMRYIRFDKVAFDPERKVWY